MQRALLILLQAPVTADRIDYARDVRITPGAIDRLSARAPRS
jgi:hypothetical protein